MDLQHVLLQCKFIRKLFLTTSTFKLVWNPHTIFFSEHFYYSFRYYTICFFPENTISPYPQPWFSSWPHPSWALLLCSFSDQTGDHTCPQVPSSQDSSVNHCKIIDISWFFCQFSRLGNPKDKSWSFLKRRPGRKSFWPTLYLVLKTCMLKAGWLKYTSHCFKAKECLKIEKYVSIYHSRKIAYLDDWAVIINILFSFQY